MTPTERENAQDAREKVQDASMDLVLWRLERLEESQDKLHEAVSRLEKVFSNYRAVMKFAVGVSAAIGGLIAFVVNLFKP